MTGKDLKVARAKLVGNRRNAVQTMADKLETPKRTYQGWEARKGQIPGIVSVGIKALLNLAELRTEPPEIMP